MAYPPAARRPWYGRWWYLWVVIAIGISIWWVFIFGGLFVADEITDTAEEEEDGIIADNRTTNNETSAILNQTV